MFSLPKSKPPTPQARRVPSSRPARSSHTSGSHSDDEINQPYVRPRRWNNLHSYSPWYLDNYWRHWGVNLDFVFVNNGSRRNDDKPGALAAILALMALIAAAVFGTIYSFAKLKKAFDNLTINPHTGKRRKEWVSALRVGAALLFGSFGYIWGVELGVYYAPALLGFLSVPVFATLCTLTMAAVGIAFTKYLIQAARWLMGKPTNTGHDSLSKDATDNFVSTHEDDHDAEAIAQAGIVRSLLKQAVRNNKATGGEGQKELEEMYEGAKSGLAQYVTEGRTYLTLWANESKATFGHATPQSVTLAQVSAAQDLAAFNAAGVQPSGGLPDNVAQIATLKIKAR